MTTNNHHVKSVSLQVPIFLREIVDLFIENGVINSSSGYIRRALYNYFRNHPHLETRDQCAFLLTEFWKSRAAQLPLSPVKSDINS